MVHKALLIVLLTALLHYESEGCDWIVDGGLTEKTEITTRQGINNLAQGEQMEDEEYRDGVLFLHNNKKIK